MFCRSSVGAIALAALCIAVTGAPAQNGAQPDDQEHRDPRENNNTN